MEEEKELKMEDFEMEVEKNKKMKDLEMEKEERSLILEEIRIWAQLTGTWRGCFAQLRESRTLTDLNKLPQ